MKWLLSMYLIFSVFISSAALLFYQNLDQILFAATEQKTISFSFKEDVLKKFAESTANHLKEKYQFLSATLHSPTDQYHEFTKSFSMYNQGAFNAEEIINLIPYGIDFVLTDQQDPVEIKKLILAENIFEQVESSSGWMSKLKSMASVIENMGRLLFLFLFSGAALMTASTVRILISQDEAKIKILSYLGESLGPIYANYFLKITGLCLLSMGLGFLISYGLFQAFLFKIKLHPEFLFIADRLHFLNFSSIFLMTVGFAVAFVLASLFALKQLFDRIYHED